MSFAAGFAAAQEGRWFGVESNLTLIRHLEKLVDQGKADPSLLEAAQRASESGAGAHAPGGMADVPTQVVRGRNEYVYQHKPGGLPALRSVADAQRFQLGTQFSLGRARWTTDDASIFSVADGKRLANTPHKAATHYESIRMAKIQRAAMETPTVGGLRLLPELTPGRAFLWGTLLAVWGTAAVVATTARQLDIQSAEDAPSKLRSLLAPVGAALEARMAPLRGMLSITGLGEGVREDTERSQLVLRLRSKLSEQRA